MAAGNRQQEPAGEAIHLLDLALACFAFDAVTHYSAALAELRRQADLPVNPRDRKHRDAVLDWLNAWRTRMPPHVFESVDLDKWYSEYEKVLPPVQRAVWQLTDKDIEGAQAAYEALCSVEGWRGGTAASKVLFAVRPDALPPWDNATRKALRTVAGGRGGTSPWGKYGSYLDWCRGLAHTIRFECEEAGFHISDLPRRLNQPAATIAMLINEYVWVKYAKKNRRPFPKPQDIRQWAKWSEQQTELVDIGKPAQ